MIQWRVYNPENGQNGCDILNKNEQAKTGTNKENQARSLSRKNCDFMPACFVNLNPDRLFLTFN